MLGTTDPGVLGRFYEQLLGWPIAYEEDVWVMLRNPSGGTGISIQYEPHHERAIWPGEPGKQQMMMHLDLGVDDLDAAVAHALESGAVLAGTQPQSGVRVMIDPAGHPFCLFPLGDG